MQINYDKKKLINFLDEKKISYTLNFNLVKNSWIKAGGEFEIYIQPEDFLKITLLIDYLRQEGVNYYTVGNISNILFRDGKILTPIINLKKYSIIEELYNDDNSVLLKVGAGVNIFKFSNYISQKLSCKGSEGLVGIPGSIGGGIFMNASSYESGVTDFLKEVRFFDDNNILVTKSKKDLNFDWRKSVFHNFKRCLIVDATFEIPLSNQVDKKIIEKKIFLTKNHRKFFQEKEKPNLGSLFATKDLYKDIKNVSLIFMILYYFNIYFTKVINKLLKKNGIIFFRKFMVKIYSTLLGLNKFKVVKLSDRTINCVVNLDTKSSNIIISFIKEYEKKIKFSQKLENIIKDKIS